MKKLFFIFSFSLVAFYLGNATANIIRVPQDQPTIQSAIEIASPPDTVLVSPGSYNENVDFLGKDIVLGSLFLTTKDKNYIAQTVIRPDSGSAVSLVNGESELAVLAGVTITGGSGTRIEIDLGFAKVEKVFGADILLRHASPIIKNNLITQNSTASSCFGAGGGIAIMDSSNPAIICNTITANDILGPCTHAAYFGGGIWVDSTSNPTIGGSIDNANNIYSNSAIDGIQLYRQGSGELINAQYNYWGVCPPGPFDITPEEQFDLSDCLDTLTTGVGYFDDQNYPQGFWVYQNYPKPFPQSGSALVDNPATVISYSLTEARQVSLRIVNIRGQEVTRLVNDYQQAGHYQVFWDGRDKSGQPVAAGLYFYHLKAGQFSQVRRMVFLK